MDVNFKTPPAETTTPDVASINPGSYIYFKMPPVRGKREPKFQVVIKQSVLNEIHSHGQVDTDVEICGVLIGLVYRDSDGPLIHISACIRGENAGTKSTQVTFTDSTWAHINQIKDEQYADQKILGWYHTHPGFGIFLSDMDVFIHRNFFNEHWQVALVYDPRKSEEGVFVWKGGNPECEPMLVEEDAPEEISTTFPKQYLKQIEEAPDSSASSSSAPPPIRSAPSSSGGESLAQSRTLEELSDRIGQLEKATRWTPLVMGLVVIIALTWPLVLLWILPRQSVTPAPTTTPYQVDPHRSVFR